jgi:hypothetical protein
VYVEINASKDKVNQLDKENEFIYQRNLNFETIKHWDTINGGWGVWLPIAIRGVFIYPGTKKNPNGKIRLLYEGFPFSYIFKIAGIDMNYNKILNRITAIDIHK